MAKMTYSELIEKLGKIVDEQTMLLRIEDQIIYLDAEYFYMKTLNKINRVLQLYGECEWWFEKSTALEIGVMYKVRILKYL
ncbi:conserved protein of unknown function [Tenacibaculum sp. 190524A02b]|uniref:hypothetical protein n=1 Tax=Tenacibaculum vairaonense TaxID=3137860 RepID=UPI0032B0F6E6